jgi:hypothetical protein
MDLIYCFHSASMAVCALKHGFGIHLWFRLIRIGKYQFLCQSSLSKEFVSANAPVQPPVAK